MSRPLLWLLVDDCPGRYDELCRMLDRAGHRWVLTHDAELVSLLIRRADVLCLDHDMPVADGRERVRYMTQAVGVPVPVIITSTTGVPGAREEMVSLLDAAGWPVLLCPADHADCEREWFWWAVGASNVMRREAP